MTTGTALLAVGAGYLLDLLIGDPHWLYHPVRLIGKLIEFAEKILRGEGRKADPKEEIIKGGILVLLVTVITGAAAYALMRIGTAIHPAAEFAVRTVLCYWLFAVRSLRDESMKVYRALKEGTLEDARAAVSMIVGRDTQELTAEGVTKAAVETVAENTSDGIIAPMFYMILGGPVLGWIYKAINTMDSMVGYKNDRYLYFGRCAAKLDDIVNFIPARLSALLMIASCPLAGLDPAGAWQIFKRDRYNHSSPNSAQTEAVMAGALQIRLAGDARYFGKLVKKPTIGDAIRPVEAEDIPRANRLLYICSAVSLVVFIIIRLAAGFI